MEYLTAENISKIIAILISIIALFTSLKKILSNRDALKLDYEFAEKFISEEKWKTMHDYLLERAYQALSGKQLDASLIRFFLNEVNPSKKLSDYHKGHKFLNPIFEGNKIIKINLIDTLTEEKQFKRAKFKQTVLYYTTAFPALFPLMFFSKSLSYDTLFIIGLWVFAFGMLAVDALQQSSSLDAAQRISRLTYN